MMNDEALVRGRITGVVREVGEGMDDEDTILYEEEEQRVAREEQDGGAHGGTASTPK